MHTIRLAHANDATQVSSLVCALVKDSLVDPEGEDARRFYESMEPCKTAMNIGKQDRFHFVAEVNGSVQGMILVRNNNHVGQFFVYPEHQGRGVGASLWRYALSHAKRAGASGGFTVLSSIAAEPIYRRFGFVPTDTPKVEHGFRVIPMSRKPDSQP